MKLMNSEEIKLLQLRYGIDLEKGSNIILDNYMLKLRKNRSVLPSSLTHTIFKRDGYVQFWFQTPPCKYSQAGKCTICNYWNGRKIEGLLDNVLSTTNIPEAGDTLLINTCGSCLDKSEVSELELKKILKWIGNSSVRRVIFETHWSTISENYLSLISTDLVGKEVFYEVGVESMSSETLFYSLNKSHGNMDLNELINLIHKYDSKCITNVVYGAPFLTQMEQINDVIETIAGLINKKVDNIVLFPVNIKPNTLIKSLYDNKEYSLVPSKIMASILLENFSEYLEIIDLAWYGDHTEENVISPNSCEICRNPTLDYYNKYNNEDNPIVRKELLAKVSNIDCGCINEFLCTIDKRSFFERIDYYYNKILLGEL